jgi:hypothetical protein
VRLELNEDGILNFGIGGNKYSDLALLFNKTRYGLFFLVKKIPCEIFLVVTLQVYYPLFYQQVVWWK